MPDSCDLPRAFLGRSQTAWNYALWGGMCWIDTNLFWPITELTIHSHWRGWEEQQKPSYMDVLDWPQVLFRGGEKCLHSSAFCHPIKQACFCLWITVRQTKNPHLKKKQTALLGGTTERCKSHVKMRVCLRWVKFGAGVDETMPTVAWWFAAHLGGC